jgi:RES domain-containing protein
MVYTADSPSLAALELLAGLNDPSFLLGFVLLSLELPDTAVIDLDSDLLPPNWQSFPAPPELPRLGDTWAKAKASLALRVPSAVIPQQSNLLLNPQHERFSSLDFGPPEPFRFDERLLKRR